MDYTSHLRADSSRFAELVAASDPSGAVPSCPDWTIADLAWHLAEVQWFWGSIVSGRLDAPENAEADKPERPADHDDVVGLLRRSTDRLVEALEGASDAESVWSWASDQTVGFVRRRQAHEALIHRVDAELAAGSLTDIDAGLAGDGVDEILHVMIGGVPEWASFHPDGQSLRITADDIGRTWGVAHGRMVGTSPTTAESYDLPAATIGVDASDPAATITGTAAQLDLWLWGRAGPAYLTLGGETSIVDRLRDLAVATTQ